jgi:16S rRNA (guanine527-N7)-methyltransferase
LEKVREILSSGLRELGIEPTERVLDSFDTYLRELKKWNKVYNLTAITDDKEIIVKHFLDSLLYLKAFPEGIQTLCDVGSGGGFPGIPIAIIRPDLLITLLEPSRKKIAFLRQVRRLLSLENVEVLDFRAEDIADSRFDAVLTRATFSVADLLKKAGHLIAEDGYLILNKGPRFEEEIVKVPAEVTTEVIAIPLAGGNTTRNLIRIRKSLKN